MPAGLYLVRYKGYGIGAAVIYVGHGNIIGMDSGEIRYDGHYVEGEDARLVGTVSLTTKDRATLVTGQTITHQDSVRIGIDLPSDFARGGMFPIVVGHMRVLATFEKLADLP